MLAIGWPWLVAYVDCKMTDICSDPDERCLRLRLDRIVLAGHILQDWLDFSHGPNLIFCTKTETQIEISVG